MEFVVMGDHEVNVSGFMHRVAAILLKSGHTLLVWGTSRQC